jgi:hypothetical protein
MKVFAAENWSISRIIFPLQYSSSHPSPPPTWQAVTTTENIGWISLCSIHINIPGISSSKSIFQAFSRKLASVGPLSRFFPWSVECFTNNLHLSILRASPSLAQPSLLRKDKLRIYILLEHLEVTVAGWFNPPHMTQHHREALQSWVRNRILRSGGAPPVPECIRRTTQLNLFCKVPVEH